MHELTVLSGKGGTGKTTVAGSLAELASPCIAVDCDVDASNLHMILPGICRHHEAVVLGRTAVVDPARCSGCGACLRACRFNALQYVNHTAAASSVLCEGCGVCALVCPNQAVTMQEEISGHWMISSTAAGSLYHAELEAGGENSGKLVSLLRRKARAAAEQLQLRYVIGDGPPGIGCPVIASLTGTTAALLVTEPTTAAFHDLKRIAELLAHFSVPAFLCVNRWDINPRITKEIEAYALDSGIEPVGRVRYDREILQAQYRGVSAVNLDTPASRDIRLLGDQIFTRMEAT